jgi:hypothetical protein
VSGLSHSGHCRSLGGLKSVGFGGVNGWGPLTALSLFGSLSVSLGLSLFLGSLSRASLSLGLPGIELSIDTRVGGWESTDPAMQEV